MHKDFTTMTEEEIYKVCEKCKLFYTCDNSGAYETCLADNFSEFEERESD